MYAGTIGLQILFFFLTFVFIDVVIITFRRNLLYQFY